MAGKIKKMIESIIEQRSGGNTTIALTTKTKIILKGIDPGNFTPQSDDDPETIEKLRKIAQELGISNL
ncbi:MAG: hypothetical protein JW795_02855 [Chitinivibrionales bacterium]|nr:hypothetical protein [Chitinivibrionales bacterium]